MYLLLCGWSCSEALCIHTTLLLLLSELHHHLHQLPDEYFAKLGANGLHEVCVSLDQVASDVHDGPEGASLHGKTAAAAACIK